ncbi:glycosyltransferase family 4 protein [Stutzerimonas balearica]|uniref:glycosyltransferase family 4 protein n=1 Tax=Stutzerimonas balearica TaxID=74829 RepID=UPI0028A9A994|nr:glycosyltransferase family 4 protein [Stutzerimonas balearica]
MRGRIAFLSPREYGQQGTPGTYQFVTHVGAYHDVRLFALAPTGESVYWKSDVPLIPVFESLRKNTLEKLMPVLQAFDPNIFYLFNAPGWWEIVGFLKENFPNSKVVLDIKTPILVQDAEKRRAMQMKGGEVLGKIDRIVTPAAASVASWFNDVEVKPHVVPLGVDLEPFAKPISKIVPAKSDGDRQLKLVYAASLDKRRQSSSLIEGLRLFLAAHPAAAVLHVFGDGPNKADLQRQAAKAGISGAVKFHGMVEQKTLFESMLRMDGAIGWVPKKLYDESPSLKVLEYMAAGLPVLATATRAHKDMENEGFTLDFCEDTPESLAEGLGRWLEKPFSNERIFQNLKAVEVRDYPRLVRERLLPILDELLSEMQAAGAELNAKTPSVALNTSCTDDTLRVVFILGSLGITSENVIDYAVDVAGRLAARGHRIYLAYDSRAGLPSKTDEKVVLFPYVDDQMLDFLVQGARLDVMVAFATDYTALIPVVKIAARNHLPLVMRSNSNDLDEINAAIRAGKKRGRARTRWESEIMHSIPVMYSPLMDQVGSNHVFAEWEDLLKRSVVAKEFHFDNDKRFPCERALHAQRMQVRLLEG